MKKDTVFDLIERTDTDPPVSDNGSEPGEEAGPGEGLFAAMSIPVASISPNPQQPRQDFPEAELKELAVSIQEHGLIQPITVELKPPSPSPESEEEAGEGFLYILHDGERRWRAHKLAGLETIPAFIVGVGASQQQLLLRAIVANDQRSDLSPIERAQGYQKLHDEHGLSDSQIATSVGKSRSTVANTRRLLGLPGEVQAQVEAGDLSERQAMALLPLYQLPEKTQKQMVEESWPGRKLKNPKNLTSDQIRNELRGAIREQGQSLGPVKPDQEYTGDGIRSPTCAACDVYTKAGKDMLCLDGACLKLKQVQAIAAYLDLASAESGIALLDPSVDYAYDQTSDFYNGADGEALQIALKKECPNLRLTFKLGPWDSGPGPVGYDQCRYTCYHNGQRCACRAESTADREAAIEARDKGNRRLSDRTRQHLLELSQENPADLLRIILYRTTHDWNGADDKVLALPPDKVLARLVRWVGKGIPLSRWESPEENEVQINAWLAKVGFPALDGTDGTSPAATTLNAQLERIGGWVQGLRKTVPLPKQIAGNLANLAELANEAQQLQDAGSDADRDQLAEHEIFAGIDQLKTALLKLQPLVEAHVNAVAGKPDDIEIDHVSWLLTVPSGDINFKSHLKAVDTPATLHYTLALFDLFSQGKTARQAIERRLRQLKKKKPTPEEITAQHAAAVNEQLDSIATLLEDDSLTYAELKHYRDRLQEIFQQQIDTPAGVVDEAILHRWENLVDRVQSRVDNIQYKPLDLPAEETA